jgi:hypothetical protein
MTTEKFYPAEENLGRNCKFWNVLGNMACGFPKFELENRRSCAGMIDDVCLYIKNGRPPTSLTHEQQVEVKTHIPSFDDKSYLPPGDIK